MHDFNVLSLVQALKRERLFKVKGGYVVKSFQGTYYVTEDGAVFKVLSAGRDRAILVEVHDGKELTRIGRAVGRVKPELAPVIVP